MLSEKSKKSSDFELPSKTQSCLPLLGGSHCNGARARTEHRACSLVLRNGTS